MENWERFLYDSAKEYHLKDSMSNFLLARQFLIDKIERILAPLKQIDENLYQIESQSIVYVGNIEINIYTDFMLPGENTDSLRIVKRNIDTNEEELVVNILLGDDGGKIQYGDSTPVEVTEDTIDLLLKHLLIDSFK